MKKIKAAVDKAIALHADGIISDEMLLKILNEAALMIPESIKQWNTTYTLNLFEDWDIEDFSLWYEHTFKEVV